MIATNFFSYRTVFVLPHRVNVRSYEQKSNLSQLAVASSSTLLCSSWHRPAPRVAIAPCGTNSGALCPNAVRIRAICHLAEIRSSRREQRLKPAATKKPAPASGSTSFAVTPEAPLRTLFLFVFETPFVPRSGIAACSAFPARCYNRCARLRQR